MKKQKIDWEKIMVIAVMAAALGCIVFLLATNIKPTGQAGAVPTPQVILDVLSNAQEVPGMHSCNRVCLDQKKICILAVSSTGNLYQCDTDNNKKMMTCMCASLS